MHQWYIQAQLDPQTHKDHRVVVRAARRFYEIAFACMNNNNAHRWMLYSCRSQLPFASLRSISALTTNVFLSATVIAYPKCVCVCQIWNNVTFTRDPEQETRTNATTCKHVIRNKMTAEYVPPTLMSIQKMRSRNAPETPSGPLPLLVSCRLPR